MAAEHYSSPSHLPPDDGRRSYRTVTTYTTVITTITSKVPPVDSNGGGGQLLEKTVRRTEDRIRLGDDNEDGAVDDNAYVIGSTIDTDHIKAILKSNRLADQQQPQQQQQQHVASVSVDINQSAAAVEPAAASTSHWQQQRQQSDRVVSTVTRPVAHGTNGQTSDGAPPIVSSESVDLTTATSTTTSQHYFNSTGIMEQSIDQLKEQSVERTDTNYEERLADYDEPYLESCAEPRRDASASREHEHEHTSVEVSLSKTSPDVTDDEPIHDETPHSSSQVVMPSSERAVVSQTLAIAPPDDADDGSDEEVATVRHVYSATRTTVTTTMEERVMNIRAPDSIVSDDDPHVPRPKIKAKADDLDCEMMDVEDDAYKMERLEEERRHLEQEMRALKVAETEQAARDWRRRREDQIKYRELEQEIFSQQQQTSTPRQSANEVVVLQQQQQSERRRSSSPEPVVVAAASRAEPERDVVEDEAGSSSPSSSPLRRAKKTVTLTQTTTTHRYDQHNGNSVEQEPEPADKRSSDPPQPLDEETEAVANRILLGKNPYGDSPKVQRPKKRISFDETMTTTTTTTTTTRRPPSGDRRQNGEDQQQRLTEADESTDGAGRSDTPTEGDRIIEAHTERVVIAGEHDDEDAHAPAHGAAVPHQCTSCGLNITAACVTAMAPNSGQAQKFHPTCFVCTYCLKALNQRGTYREHAKKPYCHECFYRLFSGLIYSFDDKNRAL